MPRWPRLVDPSDPLSYLRVAVGMLLIGATLVALGLAVTGIAPRAILLVGLLWGIYGLFYAVLDGVLEPLIDLGARVLGNIGVVPARAGFSDIETMVAQGNLELAADSYGARARDRGNAEAALRQADLLSGPLQDPGRALVELRHYLELFPRARGSHLVRERIHLIKREHAAGKPA